MKILVVGNSLFKDKQNAFALRTEQFIKAIPDKQKICLVSIDSDEKNPIPKKFSSFTHIKINRELQTLKKIKKAFAPDVIIGVNTYASYLASKISSNTPFWADLNGWIIAELQAQAKSSQNDIIIPYGADIERQILRKADKISVVSRAQKYTTIGELASILRLGKDSFEYEFLEIIKNIPQNQKKTIGKSKFIQKLPENSFKIIQIGGFNAWFDEETLFRALEKSIAKNPQIHFLTTGGIIPNVDEQSFLKFKKRVQKSKHKENFHLLGWVDKREIPLLYREADFLINVDLDCIETHTGARNRITEALGYNLPVITTLGSEISYEIAMYEAGIATPSGEVAKLSEQILSAASNPSLKKRFQENISDLIKNEYSDKIIMKNFINWIQDPKSAPGKKCLKKNHINSLIYYIKNKGLRKLFKKIWQKIK
jgi:glycosyltransferase involved in cell wall biosynthesis